VEQSGDPSWNWHSVAAVEIGNYLSIDFGRVYNGRCYGSFWETDGQVGNMAVIAESLAELLRPLYNHKGEPWHWLEPGFQALGDVYDAT
jgi:hypothetical protein